MQAMRALHAAIKQHLEADAGKATPAAAAAQSKKNKRQADEEDARPSKKTKAAVAVSNPHSRTSSTTKAQLTTDRFDQQNISKEVERASEIVRANERESERARERESERAREWV